jgi:hypothetical protein
VLGERIVNLADLKEPDDPLRRERKRAASRAFSALVTGVEVLAAKLPDFLENSALSAE